MFGFRGVFGRKPRQFDYRPRYYDPEVERREQRKRELLGPDYQEKYLTPEERAKHYVPGRYLRDNIKVRRGIGSSARSTSTAPVRLIVFLVLLGLLIWWLVGTDAITNFFAKWLAK